MELTEIQIGAGETITTACQRAVQVAKAGRKHVRFNFNEIWLLATPMADASQLERLYWEESNRKAEDYWTQEVNRTANQLIEAAIRGDREEVKRIVECFIPQNWKR